MLVWHSLCELLLVAVQQCHSLPKGMEGGRGKGGGKEGEGERG